MSQSPETGSPSPDEAEIGDVKEEKDHFFWIKWENKRTGGGGYTQYRFDNEAEAEVQRKQLREQNPDNNYTIQEHEKRKITREW